MIEDNYINEGLLFHFYFFLFFHLRHSLLCQNYICKYQHITLLTASVMFFGIAMRIAAFL